MNRRSNKNPNQNSTPPHNPGPSWQSTAPNHTDWGYFDESFWGGNKGSFKQQRWGNDQAWRPGDRGKNSWKKHAEKFPKQQLYPWSTEKTIDTSEISKDDTDLTALPNGNTSFTSNNDQFKEMKNLRREQNKQLVKGLSKPVECSIAERMMQKMGWQGGGLGVKEEGRTEPIEVNLKFINKTTGLGHNDKKQQKIPSALQKLPKLSKFPIKPVLYLQPVTLDLNQKQPKQTEKKTKKNKKQNLTINNKKSKRHPHETIDHDVLDTILDFVMDTKQIEYGFDLQYSKKERRIIHNFVEYLREGTNEEVIFDFDDLHLGKIDEINEYNNYVLVTESQGAHPNRQLFIYKEAPDEVYLVTRDDLVEDKDDDDENVIDNDENNGEIDKEKAVNENAAENINKTTDLIKDSKSNVVVSEPIKELDEKSIKTADNIVLNSILTELIEKLPNNEEAQTFNNTKMNDSDSKKLKEDKIKNKYTVANFIENCSKELNKDVETQSLDNSSIIEADKLENNLNKSVSNLNKTLQESNKISNNIQEAINIKEEDIIEIDLTESEEKVIAETATPPPKLQSPLIQESKTTEINEDSNDDKTENDMDVELGKLRGKPKLEHLEEALYIYLRDFLKHDVYVEMRFLGNFGDDIDEENELLAKLLADICAVSNRSRHFDLHREEGIYKEVYMNDTYYLHPEKDLNGGHVIYKILRNDP